ncbi:MAG: polysaccharide biosynthesis tyrosine autokinase [bacterium]|nr:polysaccharide biosynthesis tyrosine autokinase [bacterium]
MLSQQQDHGYGNVEDDSFGLGDFYQGLLRHPLLIFIVTSLTVAVTVLWAATRTPRYHAEATLLLEADEAAGGVLSELTALTSDPAAQAEIALIRSRSLAAVTAGAPRRFNSTPELFNATEPDFDPVAFSTDDINTDSTWAMSGMDALGLTTVVEAFELRPYVGITRRFTGGSPSRSRLHARMMTLPGGQGAPNRPAALDVYFPDKETVLIAPHKKFLFATPLVSGDDGVLEILSYEAGTPFQAFGYQLQLAPVGNYAKQRFRIESIHSENAIQNLMARTSASEAGRKTNVVKIGVDDPSPYLAAELANALAKNYIRRSVRIGRQKANRTLGFIERQLVKQLTSLELAETELADLQSENPETISLSDSAKAVIDQLTTLELTRTQLQLARTVLDQALAHIEAGDFGALARLGKETPSLTVLGYIQELATLEAESLRLERTDIAGYKLLLQAEQLRLHTLVNSVELSVATLEAGQAAIRAGNNEAIGHLAAGPTTGAWSVDLQGDFQGLAEINTSIAKLQGEALPSNPNLRSLIEARTRLLSTLSKHVDGALANARETLTGYNALYSEYTESINRWPAKERTTIDQAVSELRDRVRLSLASQATGLGDQLTEISNRIKEQEERLGELPQSQLGLAQATRNLQTYAEISAFLLKSKQEAQITAAATSAAAVLIDPAVPPAMRKFPMASKLIAMGILAGLILGSILALAKDTLQASLYTEAEVEKASGLTVLGSIPDFYRGQTKIKGAKRGHRIVAMRDADHSPQAEAYRAVRAALKQATRDDGSLRTLAVTSCIPGEGKTVTNANLAIAFAKAGRRVLLVDADLRRPTIHTLFNVDRGPGFAEVLEGEATWKSCACDSGTQGLTILPAGQTTSNAGELLAGSRSIEILEDLKHIFDLVIFDLPPANVVSDVATFASNLDEILLVYRAGGVPARLLTRTVSMLNQAEVNLTGIIINANYISRVTGGHGYGYGYGYSYLDEDK